VDYPRNVIMAMAEKAILQYTRSGMIASVYFKFTCEASGERYTLVEPNDLYEYGECARCGHNTKIKKAGFSLLISFLPRSSLN
jgi:rRNA maturation endonuclease Nob1